MPALTYGTEAGLTGVREPENRGDMRFDHASALEGRITQLLGLRKGHEALVRGATQVVDVGPERFAYLRVAASEAALIAVNHGADDLHLTLPAGTPAVAKIVDGLTGVELPATELEVLPHASRVFLHHPPRAGRVFPLGSGGEGAVARADRPARDRLRSAGRAGGAGRLGRPVRQLEPGPRRGAHPGPPAPHAPGGGGLRVQAGASSGREDDAGRTAPTASSGSLRARGR